MLVKTPATKFFLLLSISLLGMSALNCDNRQAQAVAQSSAQPSIEQQLVLTEQLIVAAAEEAESKEESQDLIFHFPNIFDVFRSLF